MKKSILLLISIVTIVCSSCKEKVIEEKIEAHSANTETENVAGEIPERLLMHDVFLNLKDSFTKTDLAYAVEQLKRLESIESTLWVHVGTKAETDDVRLDKDYDLALHVVFLTEEDLKVYAEDSTHAEVRANLKDLLAGPPVVYDYWTE